MLESGACQQAPARRALQEALLDQVRLDDVFDGVARLVARKDFDGMARFDIRAPEALARFIAEKGSVCLDGTSLTVNSVNGAEFSILLIPHTLAVTTWGERVVGDELNIEVDLMARYAARLVEARA